MREDDKGALSRPIRNNRYSSQISPEKFPVASFRCKYPTSKLDEQDRADVSSPR